MNYIIKDWAYNTLFKGREFDSFDDALCHLYDMFGDDPIELDEYFVEKL